MLAQAHEHTLPADYQMRPTELDDAAAVADLLNDAQEALTGKRPENERDLRNGWQSPEFNLARSSRVVTNGDGRIVGYISVWDTDPVPASVWVSGRVHPDFEDQGIATTLHNWAEGRAREALARVPEDVEVILDVGALSDHEKAIALFKARGLKQVRYFFRMAIDLHDDLPEPVLPDGIEIRPWAEVRERVSLRTLAEADEEAFQDHWGHVPQPIEEMMSHWEHWLTFENVDPANWFLALDGDEVAGLSLCAIRLNGRDDWAYLDSLAVRRPWRRKGLALALLHYTFRHFRKLGYERVELHVDASSLTGATRLYERAGMHVAEQSEAYQKVLREGRDISVQTLEE